jgi:hypothetical protein
MLLITTLLINSIGGIVSSEQTGWNWYVSKKGGYKLKYPAGADWEVDERAPFFFVSKQIERAEASISFAVGVFNETDPHLSTYEELMIALRPDAEILEVTNISLDGFPATKAVFFYYVLFGDYHKSMDILIKKEGKSYGILYTVTSRGIKTGEILFESYLSTANEMINSFRFL